MRGAAGVEIDATADVQRSVIWERVTVGPHARIRDCIVCDGVHLAAHAAYERCAIAPYAGELLQDGEEVEGSLIIKPF